MRLLMIGAGRMAEAIISGLVQQTNSRVESITVSNRSDEKRLMKLKHDYHVQIVSPWKEGIQEQDVILLATPPSTHENILRDLAALIEHQLVITVAAGIDPTFMEERLPEGTAVCWMMPNTAAQVQQSMTTYACGKYVTKQHREVIQSILDAIGSAEALTEEEVHQLTAITGSAPAFLYDFCEALEEAAVSYGMSKSQAHKLVTQMISGSAAMLHTNKSPQELRDQVTTPGGSTAAGLEVLKEKEFKKIVHDAVEATNRHARSHS